MIVPSAGTMFEDGQAILVADVAYPVVRNQGNPVVFSNLIVRLCLKRVVGHVVDEAELVCIVAT